MRLLTRWFLAAIGVGVLGFWSLVGCRESDVAWEHESRLLWSSDGFEAHTPQTEPIVERVSALQTESGEITLELEFSGPEAVPGETDLYIQLLDLAQAYPMTQHEASLRAVVSFEGGFAVRQLLDQGKIRHEFLHEVQLRELQRMASVWADLQAPAAITTEQIDHVLRVKLTNCDVTTCPEAPE